LPDEKTPFTQESIAFTGVAVLIHSFTVDHGLARIPVFSSPVKILLLPRRCSWITCAARDGLLRISLESYNLFFCTDEQPGECQALVELFLN
jgi:hypothetical protein